MSKAKILGSSEDFDLEKRLVFKSLLIGNTFESRGKIKKIAQKSKLEFLSWYINTHPVEARECINELKKKTFNSTNRDLIKCEEELLIVESHNNLIPLSCCL